MFDECTVINGINTVNLIPTSYVLALVYNEICDNDDQCTFHTEAKCKIVDPCIKGNCKCKDNYVYSSGSCQEGK